MNTIAITTAIFLLAASGPAAAEQKTTQTLLYVAPDGNDANDGSSKKPFASIARAQQAVRQLIRQPLKQNVTVLIAGGTYCLDKPLIFGPQDAAPENCTITYATQPGQKPVLSGGRPLKGWKKTGSDRWTLELPDVKTGAWSFRQLFADGNRAPRARFPNGQDLLRIKSVSKDVKTIQFDQPLNQPNLAGKNAELVVVQNWSISRAPVASSDDQSVTTANPVGWIGHKWTTAGPGKPAYLEHAIDFLDQPTEWVLDRNTGHLIYQAAPGQDPNRCQFIAPKLEQLLSIVGRKDAPVRNVTFKGLTFEYTAWPLPEFGYSGIQAGHFGPDYKKPTHVLPSAIHFAYAENCRLDACCLQHTGASGVGFGPGCRRNKVLNCTIRDIGGNGILVGWRGPTNGRNLAGDGHLAADWNDPNDAPVANEIANNVIQQCGAVNYGCVAVFDAFAQKTRIANNLVNDHPYTGISIGFRWNETPTSQRECLVEYNHIHDVMKTLADGGGIYTLGLQPGTVLRGNLIHDVHRSAFAHGGAPNNGIFFDQGSKGFLVEGQIIYNTSGKPIRFNQSRKESMTWKNNSFGPKPGQPGFPEADAKKAGPVR